MTDITPSRGLRIAVCVPSHDTLPATFAYDLAQMMAFTAVNYVGPNEPIEALGLTFTMGTYIHRARQQLADIALDQGTDYILWIDSDMRFPKDALLRLLKHREDVVGINYSKRGIPPSFVAIKSIHPPEQCVTLPDSTGLEEVEAIGFGLVLMKTKVLRALHDPESEEGPWFWFDWEHERNAYVGEDVYFCRLLRDAGFDLMVDHDLSKDCRHIGQLEYRVEHAADQVEVAV